MTRFTHCIRPVLAAAVAATFIATGAAVAAPNNSATISCGKPKAQNEKVTVYVILKKGKQKKVREWTVTIPGGPDYTAEDKADDIVAGGPPNGFDVDNDGDSDVDFASDNNAVQAEADNDWEIVGMGVKNDKTQENSSANIFLAAVDDLRGLFSLQGQAEGFAVDGLPGYVSLTLAGNEMFLPTFPGQPAEELEQQLMHMLGDFGVPAQLIPPSHELLQDIPGMTFEDGPTILLEHLFDAGFTVDVQDQGLELDHGGVVNAAALQPCEGDIDGDGMISFGDLLIVLSSWGPCP